MLGRVVVEALPESSFQKVAVGEKSKRNRGTAKESGEVD